MSSVLTVAALLQMASIVYGDIEGLCETQPRDYCRISGDPHFCTWDNLNHHFQAPDTQGYYYVDGQVENNNLVESQNGLPFDVIGIHQNCWNGRSCLHKLLVRFYNQDGSLHSQIRMTTSGQTDVLLERLDAMDNVVEFLNENTNNPTLQFQNIVGIGNYEARRETVDGKMKLRVRADWFDNLVTPSVLSHNNYDGTCGQCPSSDLVVELEWQMQDPFNNNLHASIGRVWMSNNDNGGFGGRAFGLCGTNDDMTDTDVDVRIVSEPVPGRRRLLQGTTSISYLDPCGMQRWSEINEDGWQKHRTFGNSWAVNNPGFESSAPLTALPPKDCIERATFLCSGLWFEDGPGAIGTCRQCQDETLARAHDEQFGSFLQDCIFDTCAAADAAGFDLQEMELEEAADSGVLNMAIGACATGCTPFVEPFVCAKKCTDLTSENGCANDQCLETCRNCVTGISWDDPINNAAGCQCHNNGCNQCEQGWWKVNYDFPCQKCSDNPGCKHCSDFKGCQQCEQGYQLVTDQTCGADSHFSNPNGIKYCIPIE